VPLELINLFLGSSGSEKLSLLRFLRLLRLLRLLKLLKIDAYIEQLEDALEMNLRVISVLVMLLKVAFLSHILACFWCAPHTHVTPLHHRPTVLLHTLVRYLWSAQPPSGTAPARYLSTPPNPSPPQVWRRRSLRDQRRLVDLRLQRGPRRRR
jgi:hypothetical protein